MQYSCNGYFSGIEAAYSTAAGTTTPVCEIQTGPTDYLLLLDIWLQTENTLGNQNALAFGVGRPASRGTGRLSYSLLQDDNVRADASPGVSIITEWSIKPGVPTNFLRRSTVSQYSAAGANEPKLRFMFSSGLSLAPSSSLVLWCIAVQLLDFPWDIQIVVDD